VTLFILILIGGIVLVGGLRWFYLSWAFWMFTGKNDTVTSKKSGKQAVIKRKEYDMVFVEWTHKPSSTAKGWVKKSAFRK
jgi:hypothetical protein